MSAGTLEDGNVLDRSIYLALMAAALVILGSRSLRWGEIVLQNLPLIAFLGFALLSVLWSDYPFVSFKRWIRDLGLYLVMLIAVTDTRPFEALNTMLRRMCVLLVSLSILLIKYFPDTAKSFDPWTGIGYVSGAATSKNMLGVVCLISGLYFLWDSLRLWSNRQRQHVKTILTINLLFFLLTLWLLRITDSATSTLCLVLGSVIIAMAHTRSIKKSPQLLTYSIPLILCLYVVAVTGLGLDLKTTVAEVAGRDSTLTGRTNIWNAVLSIGTNPLIGTGYESFWLGSRLTVVWDRAGEGRINQAHNGYLEMYLNLGLVGLSLLVVFLVGRYRSIVSSLRASASFGSFNLAFWTILLIYNYTEAAFKGQLIWIVFLQVAGVAIPIKRAQRT